MRLSSLRWPNLHEREFFRSGEMQKKIALLEKNGVEFFDPSDVYIGPDVTIGKGTHIFPGVKLFGDTHIGRECTIEPDVILEDVTLGDFSKVLAHGYIKQTSIGRNCQTEPFLVLENMKILDNATVHSFNYDRSSYVGENAECWTFITMYHADIEDSAKENPTVVHRSCRLVWTKIGAGSILEQGCELKYVIVGENCRVCHSIITGEKLPEERLENGERTIHIGNSATIGPWVYIQGYKDIPPHQRVPPAPPRG